MTADNIIEKGRRIVESGKYAPGFSDTAPNGDEPPLPPEPPDDGEPPPDDGGSSDATGWLSDAHVSELLVNRVLRGKYCWAPGLGWMRWVYSRVVPHHGGGCDRTVPPVRDKARRRGCS